MRKNILMVMIFILSGCINNHEKVNSSKKPLKNGISNSVISIKKDRNLISNKKLGNANICNIHQIIDEFKAESIDTTNTEYEMSDWYIVKLNLSNGTYIECETPSLQINVVQRLNTNNSDFVTESGYSVGDKLSKLFKNAEDVKIIRDIEDISFEIVSDEIYFRIAKKYWEQIPEQVNFGYLKKFPDAEISEMIVIPNCK